MEMCVLCHTPQTVDPDTGNSVDMPVMIHKIHMGAELPSVVKGGKYQIIGFGQGVNDYSHIEIPTDKRNCTVCHEQNTGAAQAQNYLTRPTQAGCGSCHDNVNFRNGDDHAGLAQTNDSQCSLCHKAGIGEEFDITVPGAHVIPYKSKALGGINWAIVKVDDGAAGKKPTVTFTLKDAGGNPLAPSDFARLFAVLAGPATDYTTKFAGQATNGYVSEDLSRATGSGGTYSYTFTNAIPEKATGTFSISLEGRRLQNIYEGLKKQQSVQYGAKNPVFYFSVDNSPVAPRRTVVTIEKCLACHVSLRLHGENRVDSIEHCVVCHNPVETDVARRPAADAPSQSVDFRQMIHNIHGGEEIKTFFGTEDYVIYGFGGSKNSFSEVKYPGRLASCDACHVNNSQMLPLSGSHAPVVNPRGYFSPTGPETAACLSCHQSKAAASHALANTSSLGESCAACHGGSADFSVGKVHAAPSVPVVPE
jgi:OmcA/MtrC family decaheme c-type cytochrome